MNNIGLEKDFGLHQNFEYLAQLSLKNIEKKYMEGWEKKYEEVKKKFSCEIKSSGVFEENEFDLI